MEDVPVWQWDAVDVVRATGGGEVSCEEVAASVVERMRAVRPLNAVTLDLGDSALEAARDLDRRHAAGETPGPLHGVCVTVKDNVDVRGQRTPNGLPGLAGVVAPDDSPVTRNLLAAGAVIVGRTNTPELSMRPTTDNPMYGPTVNPWDAALSPGGSSGGAGVAVLAGAGAIGHGNDIGGSIRIPALHCGVPGLKPTQGRVPAFVPSATVERTTVAALMSVQGPLARSVADLRLALGAMAARDPRDPWWVPAPLEGPPVPRRVALLRSIGDADDERTVPTAPSTGAALDIAAAHLAAAGYEVVEVPEGATPGLARVAFLAFRLLMADLDHQLTPVVERLGSDTMRAYWSVMCGLGEPYPDPGALIDDLAARSTAIRAWLGFLEEFPVLLVPQLLGPLLGPGDDVGSPEATRHAWYSLVPSIAVNLLGLPSVLAPTGIVDGRPTGVQLVASRYREDVALAAAAAVEAGVGPLAPLLWARPASPAL